MLNLIVFHIILKRYREHTLQKTLLIYCNINTETSHKYLVQLWVGRPYFRLAKISAEYSQINACCVV